jgi:hypothetical protein
MQHRSWSCTEEVGVTVTRKIGQPNEREAFADERVLVREGAIAIADARIHRSRGVLYTAKSYRSPQ